MAVRVDVLTLFPEMLEGPLSHGIPGRAADAGLWELHVHQIRDSAEGKHRQVDDYSFGGGPGMVMKPEPLFGAVETARAEGALGPVLLMSPQGEPYRQEVARELAELSGMILLCGRYEGIDERVREHLVDREISMGDFVLSGGEIPAMALVDSVVRLLPGALGAEDATQEESFTAGLLEYPQYTRPRQFRGWEPPEILLSGHHGQIRRWRREASLRRTWSRRPELLERADLTEEDREFLKILGRGEGGE